jgi:hypothetical protein
MNIYKKDSRFIEMSSQVKIWFKTLISKEDSIVSSSSSKNANETTGPVLSLTIR